MSCNKCKERQKLWLNNFYGEFQINRPKHHNHYDYEHFWVQEGNQKVICIKCDLILNNENRKKQCVKKDISGIAQR